MHPTTERLYKAADLLAGTSGQSAVARLLNISPQTMKNWEERGVSKQGMIDAQNVIGCSATWIASGNGEISHDGQPAASDGVPKRCIDLAVAISRLDDAEFHALSNLVKVMSAQSNTVQASESVRVIEQKRPPKSGFESDDFFANRGVNVKNATSAG